MELKFRVWYEGDNEYKEVHSINFYKQTVDLIEGYYNNAPVISSLLFEEVIIEQYVDHDKHNNRDVYVGDIVKLVFIGDFEEVTEVKSIFEFAQWNWDNILAVEIIGNIHENSELLEVH